MSETKPSPGNSQFVQGVVNSIGSGSGVISTTTTIPTVGGVGGGTYPDEGTRMDREKSPSTTSSMMPLPTSAQTSSMSSSSSSISSNNGRKISTTGKPDETIYKMAPEAVDPAILSRGSLSCRRYTKSALMLLRDEELSRICPPCARDRKLLSLGVWKVDQPNYLNQNGGGGGGSGHSGSGTNIGGGRAISGGGGLSGNTGGGGSSGSNNPKNLMDHRNVSSSLMPAFMKRRIIGNNSNNNNSGGGNNSSVADPKERIRKDQDPTVSLSPQRKSINMGCQMPTVSHTSTERETPSGNSGGGSGGGGGAGRERRIGSGRLPPRDVNWDYRPDKDVVSSDVPEYTNYRSNINSYRDHRGMGGGGGGGGANSNSNDRSSDYRERYERRPYARNNDYDRESRDNTNYVRRFISDLANQHMNSHSGNMGGGGGNDRRRQYSDSRTEEPEWFSGGPTSQHDTIELRGFDDTDEIGSFSSGSNHKNMSGSSSQKSLREQHVQHQQQQQKAIANSSTSEGSHHQSGNSSAPQAAQDDVEAVIPSSTSPPPARSTPTKAANDSNNNTSDGISKTVEEKNLTADQDREKHVEFNFEAFLNLDPLNNILVGDPKARDTGSSRFSQWFKRSGGGDPYQNQKSVNDSRRSSLHEELNNMLNDATGCSPNNRINGPSVGAIDTEKYFAPISPAAASSQTNTLLEFLQKGKFNTMPNNIIPGGLSGAQNVTGYPLDKQKPGVIPSVEELEARMRKNEIGGGSSGGISNNLHPFGQLLANNLHQQQQMGAPNSGPPQPQDMEAFKKLLEQIAPGVKANVGMNAMSAALQAQQQQQIVLQQMINRAKQEELKKIFQQQQLQHQIQQQQRNNNIQQIRLNELLFKIANGKLSGRNEVFKRPEAQAIIQGLIRGETTQANLHQQLGASTISARYREAIVTVLNYLNPNSRVASPNLGTQQILSPVPGQPPQQSQQQQPPSGQQQQQIQGGQQQPQQQQQQGQQQQPPTNSTATGLPQRIPSPRELQYHTQTIMQSALIKKKLEEQQENFRRRQEIQKQQQHHQPGAGPSQTAPCSVDDGVPVPSLNFSHGTSPPPNKQHPQSQQINSPTPLAFTPTSVLRKMTAEKDTFLAASTAAVAAIEGAKNIQVANKVAAMHSLLIPNLAAAHQQQQSQPSSQPRMILGGGSSVQTQPQQNHPPPAIGGLNQPVSPGGNLQQVMRNNSMKWNQNNLNQLHLNKPMGRPILKGGPAPSSAGATQNMMPPQMSYASKIEYQQMQQQKQQQQQAPPQPARNNPQQANLLLSQMQQQQQHQQQQQQQQQHLQQLFQQRQRAAMRAQYQQMQYHQHMLQQAPGGAINPSGNQQGNESAAQLQGGASGSGGIVTGTGASAGGGSGSNTSTGAAPPSGPSGIINYQRDGGLSPTSNQLARWFSPELLAQASAGKLPSLNMGQALSLEEFERSIQHSSATVHN